MWDFVADHGTWLGFTRDNPEDAEDRCSTWVTAAFLAGVAALVLHRVVKVRRARAADRAG